MCWSAQADAVAGTAVAALGVVCLFSVRDVRRLPLACLPLLLGVHQLLEAAVWSGEAWARTPWAVIALPLLPLLVPAGVLAATGRRSAAVLTALGAVVAVLLAAALASRPPSASPHGHTLTYGIGLPYAPLLLAGYLPATVGSLLLSGDRTLRLLGVLTGAGALVCAALWHYAFVSTWCAVAAVASLVLFVWVRRPAGPQGSS